MLDIQKQTALKELDSHLRQLNLRFYSIFKGNNLIYIFIRWKKPNAETELQAGELNKLMHMEC